MPGVYGVVTLPFSVREGINVFLEGMIPTENLRFRDVPLVFKVSFSLHNAASQFPFPHPNQQSVGFR